MGKRVTVLTETDKKTFLSKLKPGRVSVCESEESTETFVDQNTFLCNLFYRLFIPAVTTHKNITSESFKLNLLFRQTLG